MMLCTLSAAILSFTLCQIDHDAKIPNFSAFTSPVFDIFVGPQKYQFSAHQAILAQSPVLEKLCTAQASKKGRAKTSLLLPREKVPHFSALLQYLYSGRVLLNLSSEPAASGGAANTATNTDSPTNAVNTPVPVTGTGTDTATQPLSESELVVRTAKKLAKLYCVGAAYELAELQKSVTRLLSETKLWDKLPGMEFFELAEKLYTDDPEEVEGDSFAKFFRDVSSFFLVIFIFIKIEIETS